MSDQRRVLNLHKNEGLAQQAGDPGLTPRILSISITSTLHRLILEDLHDAGLEGVPMSWWIRKAIQEKLERAKKL